MSYNTFRVPTCVLISCFSDCFFVCPRPHPGRTVHLIFWSKTWPTIWPKKFGEVNFRHVFNFLYSVLGPVRPKQCVFVLFCVLFLLFRVVLMVVLVLLWLVFSLSCSSGLSLFPLSLKPSPGAPKPSPGTLFRGGFLGFSYVSFPWFSHQSYSCP